MPNIDFETRSRLNVGKCGPSRYSKGATVLCMGYRVKDQYRIWTPAMDDPQDLFDEILAEPVSAWNAWFEICMWRNFCVPILGWPEIPDRHWRCTQAASLAAGLAPALEETARILGIDQQKDKKGRQVMLKMTKPRKPTKNNPDEWHTDPEDFQVLCDYCVQDVKTEHGVEEVVPPLSPRELSIFHHTMAVNQRGIPIDIELAKSAIEVWDMYIERISNELADITGGRVSTVNQVKVMVEWVNEHGLKISSLAKPMIVAALKRDDLDPKVKKVLEIRQAAGLSSIAKYKAMLRAVESDGRVRGCTQYYGASTGRFAGRLVQTQNLTRGSWDEKDTDEYVENVVRLVKSRDLDMIEMASPFPLADTLSSVIRPTIRSL